MIRLLVGLFLKKVHSLLGKEKSIKDGRVGVNKAAVYSFQENVVIIGHIKVVVIANGF